MGLTNKEETSRCVAGKKKRQWPLTSKQQAFATLVGTGAGQTAAYRQVYDCTEGNANTVRIQAFKLRHHPYVSPMIDDTKQAVASEVVHIAAYSRDLAFQDAESARTLAHDKDQAGAAVSAVTLKARLAGHLDDSTPADSALVALAELMQSIAKAGGDAPPIIKQDGQRDGYTIEHDDNPLKTKADT
jgi:hypothetical protein